MPNETVNGTAGVGGVGGAGQTAGGQAMDAQTQAQFDQSVSTVFASILSPMVQMVLANCSE